MFVAAMLVADSIHLVPLDETDVGPVIDDDGRAGCAVGEKTSLIREAGWASVDAFIDGTAAEAIDLPAGAAARADHVGQSGRPGTQDTYMEDGEWFDLGCYADDLPEDRWLSVAETFEFLPADE